MIESIFTDHRPFIQDGFAYFLIAIALVWGGGPERVFALTWLVLFEIASSLDGAFWDYNRQLTDIDPYFAAIDLLAALVWVTSALFANRNYTLWVAAMQILALTAHLARGMVEAISPIAYAVMVIAPGWFQLLFFAIGLSRHIIRRRDYGPYRDWRVSKQWPPIAPKPRGKRSFLALLDHDFFPPKSKL